MIHKCEIFTGYGSRIRILAARENVRGVIADFDVLIIFVNPDGRSGHFRSTLCDYPRGFGVDGLFGLILTDLAEQGTGGATDEHGVVVPLPEVTVETLRRVAQTHHAIAMQAGKEILRRSKKGGGE